MICKSCKAVLHSFPTGFFFLELGMYSVIQQVFILPGKLSLHHHHHHVTHIIWGTINALRYKISCHDILMEVSLKCIRPLCHQKFVSSKHQNWQRLSLF